MNVGAMAISDTQVRYYNERGDGTDVTDLTGYGKIIGSVMTQGNSVIVPVQSGTMRWMVTLDMRGSVKRVTLLAS